MKTEGPFHYDAHAPPRMPPIDSGDLLSNLAARQANLTLPVTKLGCMLVVGWSFVALLVVGSIAAILFLVKYLFFT